MDEISKLLRSSYRLSEEDKQELQKQVLEEEKRKSEEERKRKEEREKLEAQRNLQRQKEQKERERIQNEQKGKELLKKTLKDNAESKSDEKYKEDIEFKLKVITKGTAVWWKNEGNAWVSATILNVYLHNNSVELKINDSDTHSNLTIITKIYNIELRNPKHLEAVDSLTQLNYLNDPSICFTLKNRFLRNEIYTYTGPYLLISMNPFQQIGHLYSKEIMQSYIDQPLGKLSPHLYAIAEDAFSSMQRDEMSQSVLITGVSGAGKTQNSKLLLEYFTTRTSIYRSQALAPNKSPMKPKIGARGNEDILFSVQKKILATTPLLEAFGNAVTVINHNSSRFGKFIDIQFGNVDENSQTLGATIETYLLEKSRVVNQNNGERNYHIFYQIVSAYEDHLLAKYQLHSSPNLFRVLKNEAKNKLIQDDSLGFKATLQAFQALEFTREEVSLIFQILSAILHLGNIDFIEPSDHTVAVDSDELLSFIGGLLHVDYVKLRFTLLHRNVTVQNSTIQVPLTIREAGNARNTLIMALYSSLFEWIVWRVNKSLKVTSKINTTSTRSIGILDIYGFECLPSNGFEQFCINYCNEHLQHQFNEYVFKFDQQEYEKENIEWKTIAYDSNHEILDILDTSDISKVSSPRKGVPSILSILDEECRIASATHETLANKLYSQPYDQKYFKKAQFPRLGFTIRHFAGEVTYDSSLFLEKNKDFIIQELVTVMQASTSSFISGLFSNYNINPNANTKTPSVLQKLQNNSTQSSFKFKSVSSQFKESLSNLMSNVISKRKPHYIRCIRPNEDNLSKKFDDKLVLHQLKFSGVIEVIRVSLQGYPVRLKYDRFIKRYGILDINTTLKNPNAKEVSSAIMKKIGIEADKQAFGTNKLFLRIEIIEKHRTMKINRCASVIQASFRRRKQERMYYKLRTSARTIQTAMRVVLAQKERERLRFLKAALAIQLQIKAITTRSKFLQMREAAIVLQTSIRRIVTSKDFKEKLSNYRVSKELQEIKSKSVVEQETMIKEEKKKNLMLALELKQIKYNIESNNSLLTAKDEEISQLKATNAQLISARSQDSMQSQKLLEENQALKKEIEILKLQLEIQIEANDLLNKQLKEERTSKAEIIEAKNKQAEKVTEIQGQLESERKNYSLLVSQLGRLKKKIHAMVVDPKLAKKIKGEESFMAEALIGRRVEPYIHGSVPTPGYIAFMYYEYCQIAELDDVNFTKLFVNHITKLIEDRNVDDLTLMYWLNNASFIVYMIAVFDDKNITTDTVSLDSQKESLEETSLRYFIDLLRTIYNELQSRLLQLIDPYIPLLLDKPTYSKQKKGPQIAINQISQAFNEFLRKFQDQLAYPELVKHFFSQAFSYIQAKLFNGVMTRNDICSVERAINVKLHLTLLQKTLQAEGLDWVGNVTVPFKRLDQLLNLILYHWKNGLQVSEFPDLNALQILQVITKYIPEEFEEPISESTRDSIENRIDINDTLLLSSEQRAPLSLSSLHYIYPQELLSLKIPPVILIENEKSNVSFTFLQTDFRSLLVQTKQRFS